MVARRKAEIITKIKIQEPVLKAFCRLPIPFGFPGSVLDGVEKNGNLFLNIGERLPNLSDLHETCHFQHGY